MSGVRRAASLLFAALFFAASLLPLAASADAKASSPAPSVDHAPCACIYNIDYNTMLFEQGMEEKIYPAGTVKMMVALLVLEHFDDYTQKVTVTAEMIDNVAGSRTGFEEGEQIPIEDLLAALIIANSNDAAYILSYAVAGNSGEMLKMMNERAKDLGMEGTRYLNVTGLHEGVMYTTGRDVLKLAVELYKHREYTNLSSTDTYIIPQTNICEERSIHNRNVFVSTYYNLYYRLESVSGMSCSFTGDAGYCMVITATDKAGLAYIVLVMNSDESETKSETDINAADDAIALMNWAFRNFTTYAVIDTDDMICEIPVKLSSGTDHVIALPAKRINALLEKDADLAERVTTKYTLTDEELYAPVNAGTVIGSVTVYIDGKEYGSSDLVAKNNVGRSFWLYLLWRAWKFVTRPLVIVLIVLAFALFVAYRYYKYQRAQKARRRVQYRK